MAYAIKVGSIGQFMPENNIYRYPFLGTISDLNTKFHKHVAGRAVFFFTFRFNDCGLSKMRCKVAMVFCVK